eukprot:TRINITY_DN87189_c0_g1_i1.p1 TRINITY_DN87189_c0_g1~~TRINITY_DN87189_c0_g1_i1.p1  ORF type:complete len:527 (-),score=143.04 TRINITY_DN87189_c0_g1_i1:718-2271(-)
MAAGSSLQACADQARTASSVVSAITPVHSVPKVRALDASVRGSTRQVKAVSEAPKTQHAAVQQPAPLRSVSPLTAAAPAGKDALYDFAKKLGLQVSTLEEELLQVREERDTLKAENVVIGEHIYSLQKENRMLHDMGWSTHVEKARLSQAHEGVSNEAAALQQKLQHAAQRLHAAADEKNLLQSMVETLQSEKSQLKHSVRSLEAVLDTVRADLEQRVLREGSLEERLGALARQMDEATAEKVRLDGLVSTQHVEIAQLQTLRSDIQAERERCQGLAQRLETSEMEVSRCYQEKAELDQMVSSLHVEAAQMRTQRDSALAEVPHLQKALHQQSLLMQDLESQVSRFQREMQGLQGSKSALEHEVSKLTYHLQRTREEASHHEQTAVALRSEQSKLQEILDRLRTGKAESDARLGAAAGEKGLLQAHFEQVNAEKEQMQLHLQQTTSETAALRSRLAGSERMVVDFQNEAFALQEKVQALQVQKEELERRLEESQIQQARYRPPAPLQPSSGPQGGAL